MDQKSLRLLEFDKILRRLVDLSQFAPARELVQALEPSTDLVWVRRAQAETAEALSLVWREGGVPWAGIHDIRDPLRRADIGLVLDPEHLLAVESTLSGLRRLKRFLSELPPEFPVVKELGDIMVTKPALEAEIRKAINDHGEVQDSASPALAKARSQIRTLQNRIHDRLQSLVSADQFQKYLQEALITVRNDRYVIPVRREFKAQVPGVVHDQSASGATLFVEPMVLVDLNNQLRQAQAAEAEEIQRILSRLSGLVAAEAEVLASMINLLARLDFMLAKGRLAKEQNAVEPRLNGEGRLYLHRARHPLLTGEVVPIDVQLGSTFNTLVITGPNTGGKTVTLKTVGLLTAMAQAGLHIPAGDGSEAAVFANVFADIGDEQSIEQSLSTFSAHMTNIVRILSEAESDSLVLLDELGAGTDPVEGASLAMALLDHLHGLGARTVATTHYSELKAFAFDRPGVENASVEFDVETLRPTYRLTIGIPGKSNAFEIASRLGLSSEVIAKAKDLTNREAMQMEDVLAVIAENRRATETERSQAEAYRHDYEAMAKELQTKTDAFERERHRLIEAAREEAQAILSGARREVDQLVGELRRRGAEERVDDVAQEVRARLTVKEEAVAARLPAREPKPAPAAAPLKSLRSGQPVRVVSLDATATVVSPPNSAGEVVVQAGILKVTVKASDLEAISEASSVADKPRAVREGYSALARSKSESISPEIDVRGLTVEDAWDQLGKYLDDAVLAGLEQVRVIHGKGTGALRQALRERLKAHRDVADFFYANANEGGDGATVIRLHK